MVGKKDIDIPKRNNDTDAKIMIIHTEIIDDNINTNSCCCSEVDVLSSFSFPSGIFLNNCSASVLATASLKEMIIKNINGSVQDRFKRLGKYL